MEGSYTIVFHFREREKLWLDPALRWAFSLNLHPVSTSHLSTTIFEQMDCEDGLVVKLVSSQRTHRKDYVNSL